MFDICNLLMDVRDWSMAFTECMQLKRPVSVFNHPLFKGQRFTMNWSESK